MLRVKERANPVFEKIDFREMGKRIEQTNPGFANEADTFEVKNASSLSEERIDLERKGRKYKAKGF